jgi:hypothetical protein
MTMLTANRAIRAFAAIAAASLLFAAPASSSRASLPPGVAAQVQMLANGLGEPSPRITIVRLNIREKGRLVDHIWMRGSFTCNFCFPRHNTHADLILDVHTRTQIKWHVWN